MDIAFYIIWTLIPLGFLLAALWAKLESMGSSASQKRAKEAVDLFKNFLFLAACCGITFLIDINFSKQIVEPLMPSFVPLGMFRVLLLPIVLYIGALLLGGSKPIRIKKSPRPTQKS